MKKVGLAVLVVGISLCASYGARLSPEMRAELSVSGMASLLGQTEKDAFKAWCAAGKGAPQAERDGCPSDAPPKAEAAKPAAAKDAAPKAAPTEASLVAEGQAKLATRRADGAGLTPDQAKARDAWLAAFEAQIAPSAKAKVALPTPPKQRVTSWFSESGLPFLLGLAMVVIGAVLARKAVKAEALSEAPRADGRGPVDFGVLLGELHAAAAALATRMDAGETAEAAAEAKLAIEAMQLEQFAPLVEARSKLQARYGLAGFAEVFGPFSGGERRINRAWSALVDDHWPEAHDSVNQAVGSLAEAQEALARVIAAQR